MADGIARKGFDLDLLDGQIAEQAFARMLVSGRFEVKSDQLSRRTGNIFVERSQRSRRDGEWRPSGIERTGADWWGYEIHDERWLVLRTAALRNLVRWYARTHPTAVKRGGDFNHYEGVVLPLAVLTTVDVPPEDDDQPASMRPWWDG